MWLFMYRRMSNLQPTLKALSDQDSKSYQSTSLWKLIISIVDFLWKARFSSETILRKLSKLNTLTGENYIFLIFN